MKSERRRAVLSLGLLVLCGLLISSCGPGQPPPTPGRSDGRILVHVQRFVEVCGVPFGKLTESTGFAIMGQLWVGNDLDADGGPDSFLSHVAAHELFHLIQQDYLGFEFTDPCDIQQGLSVLWLGETRDNWLGESTAQWAPTQALPDDLHYDNFIPEFYDSLHYPLSNGPLIPYGGRAYGAVAFPLFLEEHPGGGSPDIVRDMWEEIAGDPDHPFAGIDDALAAHGSTLDDAFIQFSTANYLFDDRDVGYDEGRRWSAHWWDPPNLRDHLVPKERRHVPKMRESKSGGGRVWTLGTSYASIKSDNLPPFKPEKGTRLRIDLTAWEEQYPAELDVDDLKVQLLTIAPQGAGGCPAGATPITGTRCLKVIDVTEQMETSWQHGRTWWTLESDVSGLGDDWEEIAIVVVNTAWPGYSPLVGRWLTNLNQPRIDFDYLIELTHPDDDPPLVNACIDRTTSAVGAGAVVKAEADDAGSGLAQIRISSAAPFTLPVGTRTYSGTHFVPTGQLSTWTFSAWDRARNGPVTSKLPLQDCGDGDDDGGGSGGNPGGDHPDDNLSAASAQLAPTEFAPGVRDEIRVGVLQRGFVDSARALAARAGERTWPVRTDFEPAATVEQFPVLLIPSGGLYGMEGSASFRARLEEYARRGGTIIALAQQHGCERAVLLTANGYRLTAVVIIVNYPPPPAYASA